MILGLHDKNVCLILKQLDNPKCAKIINLKLNHMHMRTPRVHSHLVAFGKQSLSIGCFSGRPFVYTNIKVPIQKSCLGMVASELLPRIIYLRTLGLLLIRPNIALVTVRPFQIDPQNSNDGATYSLIVG